MTLLVTFRLSAVRYTVVMTLSSALAGMEEQEALAAVGVTSGIPPATPADSSADVSTERREMSPDGEVDIGIIEYSRVDG
jgi:hypothetical protein